MKLNDGKSKTTRRSFLNKSLITLTIPLFSGVIAFFRRNLKEKELGIEIINKPPAEKNVIFYNRETVFNPVYTFDKLVVGPHNQMANAVAELVAKNPEVQLNPLFIYGDTGLGKTHLVHAVGNYLNKTKPGKKILYMNCKTFCDELIQSIRNWTYSKFISIFSETDVFMLEDIQFLKGKEYTQKEVFHVFNELHNINKQIILSANCSPKQLSYLADGLIPRFEWGLVVEIEKPKAETRKAILKMKSDESGLNLNDEVLSYVSDRIKSNVRPLEGAVHRLRLQQEVFGESVSISLVEKCCVDLFEV